MPAATTHLLQPVPVLPGLLTADGVLHYGPLRRPHWEDNLGMSIPIKTEGPPYPAPSTAEAQAAAAQPYVAPCIEDDLPLEVMSLACSGFRPKSSTPFPCRVVGS